MDKFTQAYLECAFWAECANDGMEPGFNDDATWADKGYSFKDIAPEALEAAAKECAAFQTTARGLFQGDWTDEQAGHDFWLTRNDHGAGFWDRGKANGEALSTLCGWRTAFPERDLYVGDDGKIWGFGE